MEEKMSKSKQQSDVGQQPNADRQPAPDLEERSEQRQSFQELIQGAYREDYLKALGEALQSQARESNRYLAYRELQFRAEALKQEYPDFDLNSGIEPKIAYEVVHHEELNRRQERLLQNAARPVENGLGGGSAVVSKTDPRTLTRAERRALRRRAARGEEIVW